MLSKCSTHSDNGTSYSWPFSLRNFINRTKRHYPGTDWDWSGLWILLAMNINLLTCSRSLTAGIGGGGQCKVKHAGDISLAILFLYNGLLKLPTEWSTMALPAFYNENWLRWWIPTVFHLWDTPAHWTKSYRLLWLDWEMEIFPCKCDMRCK